MFFSFIEQPDEASSSPCEVAWLFVPGGRLRGLTDWLFRDNCIGCLWTSQRHGFIACKRHISSGVPPFGASPSVCRSGEVWPPEGGT